MELDGLKKIEGREREERIKLAYNYLNTDLKSLLLQNNVAVEEIKISPHHFALLIDFLDKKVISSAAGKAVLAEIFESGASPEVVIKEKNLLQVLIPKKLMRLLKKLLLKIRKQSLIFKKAKPMRYNF